MAEFYRKVHPEIARISTYGRWIVVNTNQVFCETPRSWELWQTNDEGEPQRMIRRFSKIWVIWTVEKDTSSHDPVEFAESLP